jgi:hypothetical protein
MNKTAFKGLHIHMLTHEADGSASVVFPRRIAGAGDFACRYLKRSWMGLGSVSGDGRRLRRWKGA